MAFLRDYCIGFDPGLSGAVFVLRADGSIESYRDMPVYQPGKGKKVNGAELSAFVGAYVGVYGKPEAIIEQVHSMPGQGVSSTFSFGHSAGVIEGVLAAMGIGFKLVTPQQWKKHYHLNGKPKDASRALAQQLYPDAPLGRRKDCGRADALLIARYGIEVQTI